uniref:Vacuolar protein sorting-associated protein 41 homolog n=1 Tax=Plectus sambesii TaxID=2011161 RepID=A0A914VKR4_9BILA
MPIREMVAGQLEEPAVIDDGASEADSDELCEPKFKYKRILNDTIKVFEHDAASCLAVHEKFLAVGTQCGRVYIMDHLGNVLPMKSLNQHTAAVNQISIDGSGDYLISCSNDGKVIIFGLASAEYNQVLSMNRPIRSVAIANDFSKSNSGQQFATGDRTLTLHERTFFNSDKQTVLFTGKDKDGFITTISWRGPLVAFTNDTGTRVYDRTLRVLITHVVRKHDLSLRIELFPPRHCWLNDNSFVIAWANTVTVCGVRPNNNPASTNLPGKLVEIRHMFDLPDHYVAGVSYAYSDDVTASAEDNWKELVLFCVCKPAEDQAEKAVNSVNTDASPEEEEEVEKAWLPRVWLVEPIGFNDYEIISEDIIEMRDSDRLLAHHYHLLGIPIDSLYFLLGSRDMIEVRPCSADDHVDWLLKNDLHEKALAFAKLHVDELDAFSPHDVGRKLLDALIDDEHYEEAARMCPEVCGKRKDVWETYVTRFDERKKLRVLAPVLPVKVPQLEPECYEMVLKEFLAADIDGFRRLVREWSPDLYRVGGLITHALERLYRKNLDRDTHNSLLCTLGQLYTYERSYERALAIYMNLGDRAVFQLIERYRLFPMVKDRIRDLMDIDTDLAVRLLLENEESLPAGTVMRQLSKQPRLQLAYLDRLFSRNEGIEFADQAVTLYAENDPKRLLPYLRRYAEHYNIDKALETCKKKGLMEE